MNGYLRICPKVSFKQPPNYDMIYSFKEFLLLIFGFRILVKENNSN